MTRYVVTLEQRLDGRYLVDGVGEELTVDEAKSWAVDAANEGSYAVSWEGGSIQAVDAYEVGSVCSFEPLVRAGEANWCPRHLSGRSRGDPSRCYEAAELERFAVGA